MSQDCANCWNPSMEMVKKSPMCLMTVTSWLDKEDYKKLVQIIIDYKEVSGYVIYIYCFMSNHIQLLIAHKNRPLVASRYNARTNKTHSAGKRQSDCFRQ